MPKSFFERLTGSIKIRDDSPAKEEVPAVTEKPAKSKETKTRSGFGFSKKSPPAEVETSQIDGEEDEIVERLIAEEKAAKPPPIKEAPEPVKYEVGGWGRDDEEGQLTLDIYDDGGYFVVQTTVAGVRMEDLDITVTNDSVIVRGVRNRTQEVSDDRFYAKELYWGKFSRSVVLPEEVDGEKADASLKNGLLTIKIPKKSYASTRKIRIRSE